MSTATVPTKSVTADRFGAQHVVVIGSGLAGLTTALRLRRGGLFEVLFGALRSATRSTDGAWGGARGEQEREQEPGPHATRCPRCRRCHGP